jgi:hypothetical protein
MLKLNMDNPKRYPNVGNSWPTFNRSEKPVTLIKVFTFSSKNLGNANLDTVVYIRKTLKERLGL